MRKLSMWIVVLLVLGLGVNLVGDHYRQDVYAAAMAFETDSANLTQKEGQVSGLRFSYLEGPQRAGQESVIMLHGFSANKSNWLRFAKHLERDFHVVALDLMGHGDNHQNLNQSYSIVEQVAFVKSAAASMGIERFHLVGNSMGGAISSLYAATHPGQVISATLISPAGVHDEPSVMDDLLAQGKNPLIPATIDEFYQVLDFVMEEKPYIPGPVVKVEAERSVARLEINKKIFADLRKDLELGMEAKLAQIQAPVLIIWGDQDRAINVRNIDKYAQLIPNATKRVYEGIGHLAMIEVPDRSASEIKAFIGSI